MGHRASSPTSLKLASAWLLQKPPPRDKKRAIASSDFGLLSSFRRLPSLVAVEQQLSAKAKEPVGPPPPPPPALAAQELGRRMECVVWAEGRQHIGCQILH